MSEQSYTPIEGLVVHITKKAVLFKPLDNDQVWIPLSVIHEGDVEDLVVDECVEINVADWFISKEGL